MSKPKQIPKPIRRYLLILGMSFGLAIQIFFFILPKPINEIVWFITLLFSVICFIIIQERNKDIFEEYGLIKKKEK